MPKKIRLSPQFYKCVMVLPVFIIISGLAAAQKISSLVPNKPSLANDYFCTWNIQGFVCSYSSTEAQRAVMNEANMMGNGTYQGWVKFYPKIRKDLIFVMDDSWDIPQDNNKGDSKFIGLAELDQSRFPSFKGNPAERLGGLVKAVKAAGWKGLGGWVSAQQAAMSNEGAAAYWKERALAANAAGFTYWKVDWGRQEHNLQWRKMLTELGRQYAPNLVIEHAIEKNSIAFADAYRTYDVENIIAQPVTIQRIADLLPYPSDKSAKSIINCEDEPYIAVGLGCAIGVMRHPFKGDLPDGKVDFVFPPVGRNIKLRMDEVVRAVRWHKIAVPFKVGTNDFFIDSTKLEDKWVVGPRDTWGSAKIGDTLKVKAPARVSRGLPLPVITQTSAEQPFVLSSQYSNGAIAIATIGRALNREYITKRVDVVQMIPGLNNPIGIFGDYGSLTLVLPVKIKPGDKHFWAQDLAGDKPVNISQKVIVKGNKLTIPGAVIREIGLSAKTKGDISDPGLVLVYK